MVWLFLLAASALYCVPASAQAISLKPLLSSERHNRGELLPSYNSAGIWHVVKTHDTAEAREKFPG
jgi:hypothetical protein